MDAVGDIPHCNEFGKLDDNPDEPEKGLVIGVLYIAISSVGIAISCFVFYAFSRPELFKSPCYKLLVFTTTADILNLMTAGLVAGFASIFQITVCEKRHHWFYLFQFWGLALWYFYSIASMILALNRALNFARPKAAAALFGGWKPWLWLLSMVAYSVFGMLVSPTVEIYIPNRGVYIDGTKCLFHIYQNMVKISVVTVSYTVMFWHLRNLSRSTGSWSTDQIPSFGVAILGDFCAVSYLAASYIPEEWEMSEYAGMLGQLSWLALHLGTGLIYLLVNRSVHDAFAPFLKASKYRLSTNRVSAIQPGHTITQQNY
ncbi:hypothetical protein QR680_016793 [Steinernema hermaphroditum]|uniref:Uncharacterized protein n=1 Tax=Steinernema hermaphroditum TaxID=289476 RepID=A0AA39HEG6_9BILA|nr:hypothetical protein QR680_016793 [Steinernema hermaphroditum]